MKMLPARLLYGVVLAACLARAGVAVGADTPGLFEGLPPARPDPALSLKTDANDWYEDAVVYHLWVAAFRDFDGDGVGDLRGITESLDTLGDLGVTCLWLSPFFTNSSGPRNLHGYDVVDHYTADPRLGTNDDAAALVRAAHARGIRLIFDFVPNHVSGRHPWFVESRDRASPKRDWFVWRDTRPEHGWASVSGRGSSWRAAGGADGGYYYTIFGGMPDLNHRNPAVRLEVAKAARHWLDLGFDGLRVDAVKYLYENLSGEGARSDQEDRPETLEWFAGFRRDVLDPYRGAGYAKFMVAENWTDDRRSLLRYFGSEDRPAFQMTFAFPLLRAFTRLDPAAARDLWAWDAGLPARAWLGTFVSNHDLAADRPGTLFAGRPDKLRAQAAWLLLGPGTPFVYYGNETGQPQGPDRGDTKHRKSLDWAEVRRQRGEADSVWHWNQRLIRLRAGHASIRRGKAQFLETDAGGGDHVLALWRTHGDDTTLTLFNAQDAPLESVKVSLPARATRQGLFVLGAGPLPTADADRLDAGAFAPYETKVLNFRP